MSYLTCAVLACKCCAVLSRLSPSMGVGYRAWHGTPQASNLTPARHLRQLHLRELLVHSISYAPNPQSPTRSAYEVTRGRGLLQETPCPCWRLLSANALARAMTGQKKGPTEKDEALRAVPSCCTCNGRTEKSSRAVDGDIGVVREAYSPGVFS